jgi:hypothetical protein
MVMLLYYWEYEPVSLERLYIFDFYVANAPLLHETSLTKAARNELNKLNIPKPQKTFLSYPSAPILFQKMENVQKEAFQSISGRSLIDTKQLQNGMVRLSESGKSLCKLHFSELLTDTEYAVIDFLKKYFSIKQSANITELRGATGLRRVNA